MKRNNMLPGLALLVTGILLLGEVIWPMVGRAADKAPGDPARGAKTWANNCTRCHGLREPKEFRDDQWRAIMTHMRVRAGLTGQDQRDILAFLQAANNPEPGEMVATRPTPSPAPVGGAAAAGLTGKAIYTQSCVACHSADGKGAFPGVPDFTRPDGPLAKPDQVLLQNIIQGFQSPGSPMAMPPRGGNPNLTDEDIKRVLDFIREEFGT